MKHVISAIPEKYGSMNASLCKLPSLFEGIRHIFEGNIIGNLQFRLMSVTPPLSKFVAFDEKYNADIAIGFFRYHYFFLLFKRYCTIVEYSMVGCS